MNKKIDPKYIGVPNICFSLTEKDDPRDKKYAEQRIKRGFDDTETWSLRDTIGNFILPRLIRFREIAHEIIQDQDGYYDALDKMIIAFQLLVRNDGSFILNDEEKLQYEEGMQAYHDYFLGLWW